MDIDQLCVIAKALEPNDEVIFNDRSRPLTVIGFEEQYSRGFIKGSDYPYYIRWCEGNGTKYRLRWSHNNRYRPMLRSESKLKTQTSYCHSEGREITETIANSRNGERIESISVVGVDDSDLTEWTFSRLATNIEEAAEEIQL